MSNWYIKRLPEKEIICQILKIQDNQMKNLMHLNKNVLYLVTISHWPFCLEIIVLKSCNPYTNPQLV